jgi:hypothetical protein
MSVVAQRYKILAFMLGRTIQDLDRIQNSTTARFCTFDESKIATAKDAIHDVVAELEARAKGEIASGETEVPATVVKLV